MKLLVRTFAATNWHYCPTFDNPADLLTRGITSQQLCSFIYHMEKWLTSKTLWPTWNHTEALSSKPTEVISALNIEDAEVAEKETTQNTISTTDRELDQIINISNYNINFYQAPQCHHLHSQISTQL